MYSKTDFWSDVEFEFSIVKHLATKIPEGQMDFRLSPAQRSTRELLQFLGYFGISMMTAVLEEKMDNSGKFKEETEKITPENFSATVDAEVETMKELFAKFTDEEMEKEIDLFHMRMKIPKRIMLINTVLKQLVMYKMQLFLQAKASGNTSLRTMNLMLGKDEPVK